MSHRPRRLRLAAATAVLALALSACAGDDSSSGGQSAPDGAAAGMDEFYGQELDWGSCEDSGGISGFFGGDDQECAQLTVPVDYSDPEGETTTVSMARLPSTGDAPEGALIVNPGGPGGSGVDLIAQSGPLFGDELREGYDIVSFDPRGVSRSDEIQCFEDDADLDAWRSQASLVGQDITAEELREEGGVDARGGVRGAGGGRGRGVGVHEGGVVLEREEAGVPC